MWLGNLTKVKHVANGRTQNRNPAHINSQTHKTNYFAQDKMIFATNIEYFLKLKMGGAGNKYPDLQLHFPGFVLVCRSLERTGLLHTSPPSIYISDPLTPIIY